MYANIFKKSSITRTCLFWLFIFLAVIWSLTFYATRVQHRDFEHILSDQQASTVEIVAADINDDLKLRIRSLETAAGKISPAMLNNPEELQAFLDDRVNFTDLFNTGVFITRNDGVAVANTPVEMARTGTSYIDRDYIRTALLEGKPKVGAPVIGKHQKTPVFSIAVPVRNAEGKVIGAIAGVTNLGKVNFLDRLHSKHYGRSGGYLVIEPHLRKIVTATDKNRILQDIPAPGINRFVDRAVAGYEGYGVFVNPRGIEVLASTKFIPASGWLLVVELPTREAFGPVHGMLRRLQLCTFILSLAACAVAWWFIRSQRINRFLERTVDERTRELLKSEQYFRTFVENINDILFALTADGHFNYVSPQWTEALGHEAGAAIGQPFQTYLHPDDVPGWLVHLQQVVGTGGKQSGIEYRMRKSDGVYLWYTANVSLMEDAADCGPLIVGIGRDISSRKLAEKAIEESEKHYHRLVETSQDLIWQTDTEGRFTYLNLAWEQVFGYEPGYMTGRTFSDFQSAEHAALFQAGFREMMEGHSMHGFESTCIGRSGKEIILVINALFLTDEHGEFTGACGTAYDITDRKHMENTLRQSEEKYRLLLDGTSDAVFAFTPEGRYIFANRSFSVNVGKPLELIIGGTLWDVFPKEEADKRFSALKRVCETGDIATLEVCIPTEDGDRHHMTTLTPVKGPDGKVHTVICAAKNITQIKVAEIELLKMTQTLETQARELQQLNESLEERVNERTAELMESQNRIDQLSEQNCTMIWEVDVDGLYTYVNKVSEQLFGYQPEEMIGKMHFYDLFPEAEREAVKNCSASVREGREQILNMENRTVTRDGRNIWWLTNGIPVLNQDGTLKGYRGSDTDITERKKLKEQLIQSQKMEAVGQLAGGLAHDFNNVLSIINGFCYLIQLEVEGDDRLSKYVGKIQAASGRAGELTRSMLAFSRTQVMNPENQNLNWIVTKIGALIEKVIGDNISFSIVIKRETLPVYVDGGQIEQVLINLANNARDAMPDGGELTIVTDCFSMDSAFISARGFGKAGQYAAITVTDTGAGMDELTCKRVFEPFFTTKDVDKGTGLGLAMVYGIVKQHKGYIEVSSSVGNGASFVVYLPIAVKAAAEEESEGAVSLEALAGAETILIAEDSSDLLEFMRKVLSMLGYQVICAVDGRDAVEKFSENADRVKLIIMDMIMPRMSGKEAYDEIKKIRPDARALFCSGYSAHIVHRQGELGEYAQFIAKPVLPVQLVTKVRMMLDWQVP